MNQFVIEVEFFDSKVHVLDGVSDDEFYTYIYTNFGKQNLERMMTTASYWSIRDKYNKTQHVIDFRQKLKKDIYSFDTIVHESQHATIGILKLNSIPLSEDDGVEEVYCRLCAFISSRVYDGVFKK
jgi:hypothetical protein